MQVDVEDGRSRLLLLPLAVDERCQVVYATWASGMALEMLDRATSLIWSVQDQSLSGDSWKGTVWLAFGFWSAALRVS